jgi:HlyD family secretion protein
MIKKNLLNIILAILLIAVISLIVLRQKKINNHIPDILLGKPFVDVVEVKNKIAGNLVAAQEVEIKSRVSGIVEKLFLEIGDPVIEGNPIARIKPAPEPEELENARNQLKTSEIQYDIEKSNLARKIGLEAKGGISTSDMEYARSNLEIKELEMKAAQKKLRLLLEGYLDVDQKENNMIKSTARGIITELPVKEGQSIMKRNSQYEGTTIAIVANMDKLLFKGNLSEYEICMVKPGMPLNYIIGAYNDLKCSGRVIRVEPQANKGQGTVRFNFEATINFPFDSLEVKTGLTVVAEYITEKTDSVLCVEEKFLNYSGDSIYVETVDGEGKRQKKLVKPGLSDGTKIEILSGINLNDRLKPIDWK